MKVTFRDICWVAVVALIMLFLSKCHRDERDDLSGKVAAIKSKLTQDSLTHTAEKFLWEGKLLDEQIKGHAALREAEAANSKLLFSEKVISRLSAAIKSAKLLPFDTSFVTVSPEYVSYCDSIANESESLMIDLDRYKNSNAAILTGKAVELSIKDSIIKTERNLNSQYRSRYADLEVICSKVMSQDKAKAQVFLGAEILGTQNTIFQSVGGVISLKTRRNKLWQISSGLQSNGQIYGRINGNILLSFK